MVAGHPVPLAAVLPGVALAVLYVLVAHSYFALTYRHAVRTGLIARYSAESVS